MKKIVLIFYKNFFNRFFVLGLNLGLILIIFSTKVFDVKNYITYAGVNSNNVVECRNGNYQVNLVSLADWFDRNNNYIVLFQIERVTPDVKKARVHIQKYHCQDGLNKIECVENNNQFEDKEFDFSNQSLITFQAVRSNVEGFNLCRSIYQTDAFVTHISLDGVNFIPCQRSDKDGDGRPDVSWGVCGNPNLSNGRISIDCANNPWRSPGCYSPTPTPTEAISVTPTLVPTNTPTSIPAPTSTPTPTPREVIHSPCETVCILEATPRTGVSPLTVTFKAQASTNCGSISRVEFNYADGGNKEILIGDYRELEKQRDYHAGIYHPEAVFTDNYGNKAICRTSIVVYQSQTNVIYTGGKTEKKPSEKVVEIPKTIPATGAPTGQFFASIFSLAIGFLLKRKSNQ